MRLTPTFAALSLIAALCARTPAQDKAPSADTARTPAQAADPMASFSRMVGGEWKVTAQSGTSMYDTWHWGPGRHSMRVMTDGSAADGTPWREVQVFYWHPARKQVCMLGLSPYARSVSEGTIKFDGEAADAVMDLHQTGRTPVHRDMGLRWTFDGPDKYHEILSEATGPDGLKPLAEWDYVRSTRPPEPRPRRGEAPKPSERLKALEPLLNRTWGAKATLGAGIAFQIETTFEWIPYADAIYARSCALRGNGEPIHLLDAYFYHHTGTDRLRCLALSKWKEEGTEGGLYEGDVTVLDDGKGRALQLDLKGYEGDRVVSCVARLDFEKDGALRQRVWSLDGPDRTLMLDVRHSASQMSRNIMVVFQDRNQNHWFGSDLQGVYRYDGQRLTQFTTSEGLPSNRIREIQEDASGNIYITTLAGVSKFDGRTFTTLTPIESTEWKLAADDLWFKGGSVEDGPYRYDGRALYHLKFPKHYLEDEYYSKNPRSAFSPYGVYSIYKDSKGTMWFGTAALGVCRFDGQSLRWLFEEHLTNPPGGGSLGIRSMLEDKQGKFWISNTTYRFDVARDEAAAQAPGVLAYKREPGIASLKTPNGDDLYFMSITEHEGELWMATWGAGVWRYDGDKLTHYPIMDGDKPTTVFSIYKDRQGALWLGTHTAGSYKFNGKNFEPFVP